jgi:hypothetical protein
VEGCVTLENVAPMKTKILRAVIGIVIANAWVWAVSAFVANDMGWLSHVMEWHPVARFCFVLAVILLSFVATLAALKKDLR